LNFICEKENIRKKEGRKEEKKYEDEYEIREGKKLGF